MSTRVRDSTKRARRPRNKTTSQDNPDSAGGSASREVLNANDVAAFLGVDRKTVYEYAGRGEIPHQRLGKRLLFSREALLSWLQTS